MEKSPTSLSNHVQYLKCLILFLVLLFGSFGGIKAQKYYQPAVFDPSASYPFVPLGWLFNPQPYLLTGIPTLSCITVKLDSTLCPIDVVRV